VRPGKIAKTTGFLGKLKLAIVGLTLGERVPDILRVLFYRPDLFGKHFSVCLHRALRGPSEWSVGERELFAAFVSQKNQCRF
jgi:hypothetical protein